MIASFVAFALQALGPTSVLMGDLTSPLQDHAKYMFRAEHAQTFAGKV